VDRVEAGVREHREVGIRSANIRDAERLAPLFVLSQRDHPFREVDAGHARTAAGENPRVVAFAAAHVEHAPAAQVTDERQEGRIVEPLAGHVGAAANLLGPRSGVRVPVARDILDGEIVSHARVSSMSPLSLRSPEGKSRARLWYGRPAVNALTRSPR